MRTTISLDEQLLRAAKRLAAQRGTTLSTVIADALRAQLATRRERDVRPFKLITFRGDGPREGIDLDRSSSVQELEDIERYGKSSRATR